MKIYKVKVNGKVYEVELESVTESNAHITTSTPAPVVNTNTAGTTIKAPMQGVILDIKVKAGDNVKKGQVVAILEAMKLENEIVASEDGVVKQVLVNKGQTVNSQDSLLIIG